MVGKSVVVEVVVKKKGRRRSVFVFHLTVALSLNTPGAGGVWWGECIFTP